VQGIDYLVSDIHVVGGQASFNATFDFAVSAPLVMKATLRRESDRAVLSSTAVALPQNSGSLTVVLQIHDEYLPLSGSDTYQLLSYVFVDGSPVPNYDYAIVSELQTGLTLEPL
jgi:hypothetical protein